VETLEEAGDITATATRDATIKGVSAPVRVSTVLWQ
jgi:hypothetical protein